MVKTAHEGLYSEKKEINMCYFREDDICVKCSLCEHGLTSEEHTEVIHFSMKIEITDEYIKIEHKMGGRERLW
jgi:hypothetical protein